MTRIPCGPRSTGQVLTLDETLQDTVPALLALLDALRADPGFGKGVSTYQGYVTSQPVAEALGLLPQFQEFATL